jgi:FMN phosphatase YigB (HAD superfamily)
MKLLSDFDGVLTDPSGEARRVRELFDADLAAARPGRESETRATVAAAEATCDAAPHAHGWSWEGRITAYVNEDPFVRVNGIAARLDLDADAGAPGPATLRDALRARGRKDFRDAAQASYVGMTQETAAGKIHPLDPVVGELFRGLMGRGVEIVVVSNSRTDRILQLLRGAGLAPVGHGEGDGPLRVRGDAKKFVLGADAAARRAFAAGRYEIHVDRPHYETILREERPDFVMGDVFSLDLALPLHLGRTGDRVLRDVKLLLRRQAYSPEWPAAYLAADPAIRWAAVDRLADVPVLMRR